MVAGKARIFLERADALDCTPIFAEAGLYALSPVLRTFCKVPGETRGSPGWVQAGETP
jgi:hypothetical protein